MPAYLLALVAAAEKLPVRVSCHVVLLSSRHPLLPIELIGTFSYLPR